MGGALCEQAARQSSEKNAGTLILCRAGLAQLSSPICCLRAREAYNYHASYCVAPMPLPPAPGSVRPPPPNPADAGHTAGRGTSKTVDFVSQIHRTRRSKAFLEGGSQKGLVIISTSGKDSFGLELAEAKVDRYNAAVIDNIHLGAIR